MRLATIKSLDLGHLRNFCCCCCCVFLGYLVFGLFNHLIKIVSKRRTINNNSNNYVDLYIIYNIILRNE